MQSSIPTLCASSTVAAAAIGYSFGRPQQSKTTPPTTSKRKTAFEAGEFEDRSGPVGYPKALDNTSTQGSVRTDRSRPKSSADPPISTTPSGLSGDIAQLQTNPEFTSFDYKVSGTARSSWLRRFSTLSSTHTESRPPSLSAPSASMSLSNRSTTPMLGSGSDNDISPLPPNKLVKRATSEHVSGDSSYSTYRSGYRSRMPSLRRPATSHQRSASLHHWSIMDRGSEREPQLRTNVDSPHGTNEEQSVDWSFHFRPRRSKYLSNDSRHISGGSRKSEPGIRRISPETTSPPTLVLASSITSSSSEDAIDHSNKTCEFDRESFFLESSRPATPLGLESLFTPHTPADSRPSTEPKPRRTPRRSFSIGDMLSSKRPISLVLSRSSLLRVHSKAQNKERRISSAPTPTMSGPPSSALPATEPVSSSSGESTRFVLSHQTDHDIAVEGSAQSGRTSKRQMIGRPRLRDSGSFSGVLSEEILENSSWPASLQHLQSTRPNSSGPLLSGSSAVFSRQQRLSAALSDHTSTLVGSDQDGRGFTSADEDEFDLQSETVFDSLRTGATSSTAGFHKPRIETIFDESPPAMEKEDRLEMLRGVSWGRHFQEDFIPDREAIGVDSTYSSVILDGQNLHNTQQTREIHDIHPSGLSKRSSVLSRDASIVRTSTDWDAEDLEHDKPRWSFEDDEEEDWSRLEEEPFEGNLLTSPQFNVRDSVKKSTASLTPRPARSTSNSNRGRDAKDSRGNIFDWSEHQAIDKSAQNGTDVRPRTVHGKQDINQRGNRSNGRRRPSAMHVRSQSVPVVPDLSTARENAAASSRFGTWGVGSKGVSEDWNEDFEFEGLDEEDIGDATTAGNPSVRSSMVVPQAIQERQANVLGHLGHVREFALMVEDLKRLRTLAVSKGITNGPRADLWKEADGIINLATLEDEDDQVAPSRSTRQSFDDFESEAPCEPVIDRHRRRSVLSPDDDIFGCRDVNSTEGNRSNDQRTSESTAPAEKLRTESTAVAKSLVESMHQRRSTSDPLIDNVMSKNRTPFDTTTLKDLVGHVSVLTRSLAELVRDSERLPLSFPEEIVDSPVSKLSQVFSESANHSPTANKERSARSKSQNGMISGATGKENELAAQMKLMTVV